MTAPNPGDQCRHGKCGCPRCVCGYAAGSPGCVDHHARHPYSRPRITP